MGRYIKKALLTIRRRLALTAGLTRRKVSLPANHGRLVGGTTSRPDPGFFRRNADAIGVDLLIGAIFTVIIGGVFLVVQVVLENERAGRAEALEEARAQQAQNLEDARAERAEMLADLAYVRETLRDGGSRVFQNLNLRQANLSGLDLGCDPHLEDYPDPWRAKLGFGPRSLIGQDEVTTLLDARIKEGCADFSGTDFTGTRLDDTDLSGAVLDLVTFAPAPSSGTSMVGTYVSGHIAATLEDADLRAAQLRWAPTDPDIYHGLVVRRGLATGAMLDLAYRAQVRFVGVDVAGAAAISADPPATLRWGEGCYTWSHGTCSSVRLAWTSRNIPDDASEDYANSRYLIPPEGGCATETCQMSMPTGIGYYFPTPDQDELSALDERLSQVHPPLGALTRGELRSRARDYCAFALGERPPVPDGTAFSEMLTFDQGRAVRLKILHIIDREPWCVEP